MSVASPSRAAFPGSQEGRHPRLHFRGLLRLHSNYGPLDRSTAQGGLCHRASIHPVTRTDRLPATRSNRQLSGWFLPPLVIRVFWAHYDIEATAGVGAYNDNEEVIDHAIYRHQWLRELTQAAANSLAVIRVRGDSMWATLHHGDHVLVDRTAQRFRSDGLYIVRMQDDDDIQVKRLQRRRRGVVHMLSDNPDYPTIEDVPADEIQVMGRVVWLGRQVV